MSKFEWVYARSDRSMLEAYDRPLFEDENVVVLASLGALVPGWTIVIPKLQCANIASLPPQLKNSVFEVAEKAKAALSYCPGTIYAFEHGASFGSIQSCGVDQAHLHLVPLDFDFVSASLHSSHSLVWTKADPSLNMDSEWDGQEYLFLSDFRNQSFLTFPQKPVTQWFRRVIANALGKSNHWNYREYPELDNVASTIGIFNGDFAGVG